MISFEKVLTKNGVGVLPDGDVGPVGLRKVVRSLVDQVRQWHSCCQRLNDILWYHIWVKARSVTQSYFLFCSSKASPRVEVEHGTKDHVSWQIAGRAHVFGFLLFVKSLWPAGRDRSAAALGWWPAGSLPLCLLYCPYLEHSCNSHVSLKCSCRTEVVK